ncbi:hypothetical protein K503DRAFT_866596 [Rhizopogon vinicolor AM-OR11-026]|uniref:Uncharacterized protein n=1 Tax=Rhizopogon vinicolor AM-OR11-026 TaxID=1314800 RepID=A0A1B7MZ12_9AGAM|nr:hypothetical protein K503DRAFT_866596 [Rhizopogon vinicolor AM-OR11-026]
MYIFCAHVLLQTRPPKGLHPRLDELNSDATRHAAHCNPPSRLSYLSILDNQGLRLRGIDHPVWDDESCDPLDVATLSTSSAVDLMINLQVPATPVLPPDRSTPAQAAARVQSASNANQNSSVYPLSTLINAHHPILFHPFIHRQSPPTQPVE